MYHRTSPRATWYDYTSEGIYFVTICTKERIHYFGDVVDGKMMLNELGSQVLQCRNSIPMHYPLVEINEFICMPNHIHGILIIRNVGTQYFASGNKNKIMNNDEINKIIHKRTHDNASLQNGNKNLMPNCASGSLGSIIRGFKIGVAKYAKNHHITFARQSRYHDHIIRDEREHYRIQKYIENNPLKWYEDKLC